MPTPGDAGEASGSSPPSLISALLPLFSPLPLAWHVLLCRRERQRRGGGSKPLRQYAATAYGNDGGGVAWQACVRVGRCTAAARLEGRPSSAATAGIPGLGARSLGVAQRRRQVGPRATRGARLGWCGSALTGAATSLLPQRREPWRQQPALMSPAGARSCGVATRRWCVGRGGGGQQDAGQRGARAGRCGSAFWRRRRGWSATAVSRSGHSGGDEGNVDGGGLPWGPRCVGSFLVTFPGPSLCRGGGI